jgi:mRNA-degrading endonuclease YafQ of YafQ-DinJ toxin-antitoxin module
MGSKSFGRRQNSCVRDVKLAQKRGKDMAKLREVILLLIQGNPLPGRYKDHSLGGAITATATSSQTGC